MAFHEFGRIDDNEGDSLVTIPGAEPVRFDGAEFNLSEVDHDPAHAAIFEMGRGALEAARKENT